MVTVAAVDACPLPAGWRVRDPAFLWSVAYKRRPDGSGVLDADPATLGVALRRRCYHSGVDVGYDALSVLRTLLILTGRGPLTLEPLPVRCGSPPAETATEDVGVSAPVPPPAPRRPPVRRLACQVCLKRRMFDGRMWCPTCGRSGYVKSKPPAGSDPPK